MRHSHLRLAVCLLIALASAATAQDNEDQEAGTNNTYRSPWEVEATDDLTADDLGRWSTSTSISSIFEERERLFPKKDEDSSGLDSRPTRKVYGIDNRGDRELYPRADHRTLDLRSLRGLRDRPRRTQGVGAQGNHQAGAL